MPNRRKLKPKVCPYTVPWFGRALWIADRYSLPFEDVEQDLWLSASALLVIPNVVEDYMLAEKPDCNVGCSLCAHLRQRAGTLPAPCTTSPQIFVRSVATSTDPKVRAAVRHILQTQEVRNIEPPNKATRAKHPALDDSKACCSFCGRIHLQAGPLIAWRAPSAELAVLYLCRQCAVTAIEVIDIRARQEPPEVTKPAGIRPEHWKRIVRQVKNSNRLIARTTAKAPARPAKPKISNAEIAERIAAAKARRSQE